MANILIYDTNTNKVLQYLKSMNTPDYLGRSDVLIHPDVSHLESVPLKYWKVDGDSVVEITQGEKDAITQAEQDTANQNSLNAIDNFNVSNLDIFTALVRVINVRIPGNPITKQELINQIKQDLGL